MSETEGRRERWPVSSNVGRAQSEKESSLPAIEMATPMRVALPRSSSVGNELMAREEI